MSDSDSPKGNNIGSQKEKLLNGLGVREVFQSIMKCQHVLSVMNRDKKILMTNIPDLYGNIKRSDIIGTDVVSLVSKSFREDFSNLINDLLQNNEKDCADTISKVNFNEELIVKNRVIKIRNSVGEVAGFMNTMMDITKEENYKQRLKEVALQYGLLLTALFDKVVIMDATGEFDRHIEEFAEFHPELHEIYTSDEENLEEFNFGKDATKLILEKTKETIASGEHSVFSFNYTQDKKKRYCESSMVKVNDHKVCCVIHDITDKIEEHEMKEKSIKEKALLSRELSHRVINTIQVIASQLNFFSRYLQDDADSELIGDLKNWISSMGSVHDLYHSSDLEGIDVNSYIKRRLSNLFAKYKIDRTKIECITNINTNININTAIPCCSILNELISNSLKHAFPGDMQGKIIIKLDKIEDYFVLEVLDNGIGMPKDVNKSKFVGMDLINLYVNQMNAEIEMDTGNGTYVKVVFKEKHSGFSSKELINIK